MEGEAASTAALRVECAGVTCTVTPPQELTFGRSGDLVVDEANLYLHRIVGRFFWHGAVWWLENLGRRIDLELIADTGAITRLPACQPDGPRVVASLATSGFRIVFTSGGFRYELVGSVSPLGLPDPPPPPDPSATRDTAAFGQIDLTPDERRLLLALAEPCLRDPTCGPEALPSNRAVAHQLGWPVTKFNRKLDYLCTRLTRAGVRGLYGERGAEATNRRWRLVEHAINARAIRPADLDS